MLCQKCKFNHANVELRIQVNDENKKIHLCSKCYKNINNKIPVPNGLFHNNFPFGDFANWNGTDEHFDNKMNEPVTKNSNRGGGILDQLGRNITTAAKAGLIDPVIGRDKEIQRVIEILNRRNKNNPVLIGEPGVGKTAVVEGLALHIAEGKVPAKLKNKEVYLLDVASLVANTGIRGQFEERMKQIIQELQEKKNIILFIDEIHLLVGAGSAEGSMDAGNILKPTLARGELQLVGATTLKEYRLIEKDAALERRFQPVTVTEPTLDAALTILKGIRHKYEEFHQVKYSEDALKACVNLSHRYIQDRHLPDKAIDLLDEAGSKKNLIDPMVDFESMQIRLKEIETEKQKALKEENYETAAKLRDEELKIENELKKENKSVPTVSVEDVEAIISEKSGIPLGKIQNDEQNQLKNLEGNLNKKVIGQHKAVEKVAKAIKRNRIGIKRKNRPVGSFLFVGPTGVGKTELTKSLAEELFGTKDSMIRLDMSEYMEKHSVSKLIGSPPGYVGHEEAGQLTEKVRRNPYSIILLDEIEKAHPDVQHIFLQVMEDGRLTDSQGRNVNFKDAIIIMTSNAGVTDKKITVGFSNTSKNESNNSEFIDSLSAYFKPEFLNRFDGIIQFDSLNEKQLVEIVDIMLTDLMNVMKEEHGITLSITDKAKVKLAQLGYHPSFGARPLRRIIEEKVEDKIVDLMMENTCEELCIDVDHEESIVIIKHK
ncbi:ATP-dependent Clp protease ATP-binding subunit [Sutcliffiella sp. NC1]|uniref:ATP-dependent Clp protease ATP-binding subunit n=1 Tax=Sutcliffiella sp. NC1 TaxID=3004096 RepID=UPI0022DDB706|nr:ATP-dependent Clp protease ATP-binding subunit [Sutcliffiella sp. NC1]WBL13081.1 ATP-dependent Clp protease ATP-binding subunit [Sutcliffiella sp. NC1]